MKSIGEEILDEIIKQGMVRADDECPNVLIWAANAHEQLEAVVQREIDAIYRKWDADKRLFSGAMQLLKERGGMPCSQELIDAADRFAAHQPTQPPRQ